MKTIPEVPKIRVLFLHRHATENGIGGVIEYLHYLPLALRRYGIEVLLYREVGQTAAEISGPVYFQNGMPVYSGPFQKPRFFTFTRKLQQLVDLCARERIQLVHAQGTYRSGYVAMQLYQQTGIPYVVTSHSDIIPHSARMQRKKVLKTCQKILKGAAQVTHLSPPMAELSHRIYPALEKSTLIGNGIDHAAWLPYQHVPPQNYLLALGRLELEKGFHILIDAYAALSQRGFKTSLVLAGSGSAETMLQERVKKHGLRLVKGVQDCAKLPEESVIFTGYVRGDLKKQLIAQSKMILFPTQPTLWEEPFGIVQIEAMAAGKPLIASDSAITRHLQGLGLQALLATADSVSAWTEQMALLLSDPEQQAQLGRINLERAAQFDWDLVAGQYSEVYRKILRS